MTEQDRIAKASEWRDAAQMRLDHAKLQTQEFEKSPRNDWNSQHCAQMDAYYDIQDGMLDRIHLINALFPELTTPPQKERD